jgi:glyoxylase-like metal-dependent hydrolase (beta-lactamase superfamily II)
VGEPTAVAESVQEVVPGIFHWMVEDDRIGGFLSSSHAVWAGGVSVLIDPLPLAEDAMERLGTVEAIVLSCGSHQRSSWRLRRELGVAVYAPEHVRQVDEDPDVRYREGDPLPAGLQAVFAPGPGTTQHFLLLPREGGVLFTGDTVVNSPRHGLAFVPEQFDPDRNQTRQTTRRMLDLEFAVLCVGHGPPVTDGPKRQIAELLERGS